MHCNGRCQMMKKMQQEEKKDQENPERKNDNKNEVLLSSKSFFAVIIETHYTIFYKVASLQVAANYSFNYVHPIFHPPGV